MRQAPSQTPQGPYLPPLLHPPYECRQVFYATIGASANVTLVLKTAPVLFAYSFVAIAGHLGLLLIVGGALGLSRKDLLLASNANIGGTHGTSY